LDAGGAQDRIIAIINDTALQLRQSSLLQDTRGERIQVLRRVVEQVEEKWRLASTRLDSLKRLPSTELQEELRSLNRRTGCLEAQIEELDKKADIIRLIDEISAKKNQLNDQITSMDRNCSGRACDRQVRGILPAGRWQARKDVAVFG
jgi:hypothetical protein